MIQKDTVQEIVLKWLADKDYFLVSVDVDQNNRIVIEIDHSSGVWIDDCVKLSRFIEENLDRDIEDYELEVGSAGLGQPFKVQRQYLNCIGKEVEVLDYDGKKYRGILNSVKDKDFTVMVKEKVKLEGKKRPTLVEKEKPFNMDKVKYTKYIISFK